MVQGFLDVSPQVETVATVLLNWQEITDNKKNHVQCLQRSKQNLYLKIIKFRKLNTLNT
jgi:hypothetical protein